MKIIKKIVCVLLVFIVFGCSNVNLNKSKKALLVVSFGSTFIQSRKDSIDVLEEKISKKFPGYDLFTAYTSQMIIDVYSSRDNIDILNVDMAIEKIYKAGYGDLLIVPTHVINGEEYDQMINSINPFMDKISQIVISKPLLSHVDDYKEVAKAIVKEIGEVSDDTAIVLMGHGTHHDSNSAYPALDYVFKHMGLNNVYVGTVEGFPSFDDVNKDLKDKNYKNVLILPLMIVAGDHAHNDMAGDDADSWKNLFKTEGYNVEYRLQGIGELESIQEIFLNHVDEALMEVKL